jgi:D-alanyl-D-alanine carboxypeptidase
MPLDGGGAIQSHEKSVWWRELMTSCATCVIAAALFSACAPRGATPRATDEPRPPPPDLGAPATPAVGVEPQPPPPDETPLTAKPRLAWVNPARCVTPCSYDPTDVLVHVDDQGVPNSGGAHRIDPSIQDPLRELVTAARTAGHKLRIESAFRSYAEQEKLFKQTKQIGRAARPGHSEHQLGTTVDFRLPTTAAGVWLAEHAPSFGFAHSYPDGKQRVTGYRPEPWHVRFIGIELARELRTSGSTLEELFRARADLGESGGCEDCPTPTSHKACGTITAAGTCTGTVLKWCYDDALAAVDCAASKQRCGRASGSDEHGCLAP